MGKNCDNFLADLGDKICREKREAILKAYLVNDKGVITSPGQFEGEMLYVPYFWEIYLNGGNDRDDGDFLGFDVQPEDKRVFPELGRKKTVTLFQHGNGFIYEVLRG